MLEFFFFNDTATTEIYTLSLHDALPISTQPAGPLPPRLYRSAGGCAGFAPAPPWAYSGRPKHAAGSVRPPRHTAPMLRSRSEEHTSELQSRQYLVCRLLLEKKKAATRPAGHDALHIFPTKRAQRSRNHLNHLSVRH